MKGFIAALTIVCALAFCRGACGEAIQKREPPISAEESIKLAKKHLAEKKVDVSRHYIDSMKLASSPGDDRGRRWVVTWELKEYAKGGQVIVQVFMNKAIVVGYGE